jgi:Cu(I)/Ag(I) efflux system membrane fusion protein
MTPESNTPKSNLPRTAGLMVLALAVGAGGTWLALRNRLAAGGAASAAPAAPAEAKRMYQCPMHPQVIMDHEDNCPICGMRLVEMEKDQGAPAKPAEAATPAGPADKGKIAFYRNPMDPKITSPVFTKDSMGMDYIPVYESELKGAEAPPVEGLATVKIDAGRQQLIGLTTATAVEGAVGGAIRTTARVAVDETRVRHIHVKVDGYVEKLFVDFVGKPVAQGQPLFSLYSPDFVSAQEEFFLAQKTQKDLAGGSLAGSGKELLEAARRRMELWDVPPAELDQIERSGQVRRTLTLRSPISGVVTAKSVVEGIRVTPADTTFEITDLSRVWGIADVYESELPKVRVGMPADLVLGSLPGRSFRGRVAFVDPQVDPKSRTVKVRVELPNPKGELKPEMYGEMSLQSQARKGLTIPVDAVLDAGVRKIVFVALGEGRFQPREVQVGANLGESVEILGGLKKGEAVVSRANFLVDSESRLKAALAQFTTQPAPEAKPAAAPAAKK